MSIGDLVAFATAEKTCPGLRFEVLGQLRVLCRGQVLDLGPRKQQEVLAILLLNANSLVTVDALVDALWAERPPRTARKNLQVYVSGLRKLLSASSNGSRITHRMCGYVLSVRDDELDVLSFERLARAGRNLLTDGRLPDAAGKFAEALSCWQGTVLEGMHGTPAFGEAAQRLEGRYLGVFEDWVETQSSIGDVSLAVVEKIATLVERHPFRERLRMAQMTMLSRLGRRTEALAVFDELRRALAVEFGLAPSAALVQLQQSLLRESSCSRCGGDGSTVVDQRAGSSSRRG